MITRGCAVFAGRRRANALGVNAVQIARRTMLPPRCPRFAYRGSWYQPNCAFCVPPANSMADIAHTLIWATPAVIHARFDLAPHQQPHLPSNKDQRFNYPQQWACEKLVPLQPPEGKVRSTSHG